MNNPGFKNCIDILEVMKKYSIRNKTILSECPKEAPSKMIESGVAGVEPWTIDMIKLGDISKEKQTFEREYASCYVNNLGDGVEQALLAAQLTVTDMMIDGGIKRNQTNMIMARNHGKSYFLKNMYYELSDPVLIEKEDSTTKPPKGRTQKAHNAIQNMNNSSKRRK